MILLLIVATALQSVPGIPGSDTWAQIQKELNEPVSVAKVQGLGRAQTSAEHRAATRGIGLNRDDPEPFFNNVDRLDKQKPARCSRGPGPQVCKSLMSSPSNDEQ